MNLNIEVKSLNAANKTKRNYDAILTIEDPFVKHPLRFHSKPHPDQMILMFEDVDQKYDNIALPHMEHVDLAIKFGREYEDKKLLIHCHAGVARSTALALGIIADRLGKGKEVDAVDYLLKIRDCAIPNLLVLDLVDTYLNREGKLKAAWMEIEHSHEQYPMNRKRKEETIQKSPFLYREPFEDLSFSAYRIFPNTLNKEFQIDVTNELSL